MWPIVRQPCVPRDRDPEMPRIRQGASKEGPFFFSPFFSHFLGGGHCKKMRNGMTATHHDFFAGGCRKLAGVSIKDIPEDPGADRGLAVGPRSGAVCESRRYPVATCDSASSASSCACGRSFSWASICRRTARSDCRHPNHCDLGALASPHTGPLTFKITTSSLNALLR